MEEPVSDPVQRVRERLEFYFGDVNLAHDGFMRKRIEGDKQGFVPISVLLTFNTIKAITTDPKVVVAAAQSSSAVQVSEDNSSVQRTVPIQPLQDFTDQTLFVGNITEADSHKSLIEVFSPYGDVQYVSIPHDSSTKSLRGFAFVEFRSREGLERAMIEYKGSFPIQRKREWQQQKEQHHTSKLSQHTAVGFGASKPTQHVEELGKVLQFSGADVSQTRTATVRKALQGVMYFTALEYDESKGVGMIGYLNPSVAKAAMAQMIDKGQTLGGAIISVSVAAPSQEQEFHKRQTEGVPKPTKRGTRGGQGSKDPPAAETSVQTPPAGENRKKRREREREGQGYAGGAKRSAVTVVLGAKPKHHIRFDEDSE